MVYYQYYVEGECEKVLVDLLKTKYQYIIPGKVEVLNVVEELITDVRIRLLKKNTKVVLIYDTDTTNTTILRSNIKKLNSLKNNVDCVICIPQSKNLEDELIRCTNVKHIKELLPSQSNSDFKRDFSSLSMCTIKRKLDTHCFNFSKLWINSSDGIFSEFPNEASKIKK